MVSHLVTKDFFSACSIHQYEIVRNFNFSCGIWFMYNRYAFSLFSDIQSHSVGRMLNSYAQLTLITCDCILPKMAENNAKGWHQFVCSTYVCGSVLVIWKFWTNLNALYNNIAHITRVRVLKFSNGSPRNLVCWSAGILIYNWNGSKLSCFPFNSLNDS